MLRFCYCLCTFWCCAADGWWLPFHCAQALNVLGVCVSVLYIFCYSQTFALTIKFCTLIRSFPFSYLLNAKFFCTTKTCFLSFQHTKHPTDDPKILNKKKMNRTKTLQTKKRNVNDVKVVIGYKKQKYSTHSMFSRSIKFNIFAHIVN